MKEYQGHRSWNAWNVALYIANEYDLYEIAVDCLKCSKTPTAATRLFLRYTGLLGERTPDGAVYNRLSVKLALEGLEIEQKAETRG